MNVIKAKKTVILNQEKVVKLRNSFTHRSSHERVLHDESTAQLAESQSCSFRTSRNQPIQKRLWGKAKIVPISI